MNVNQYVRKIKSFKMKEDSKESRERIAVWLLTNLADEGGILISSGQVKLKEDVMKVLYVLDNKWRMICHRVPNTLNPDGWGSYVWTRWKINILPQIGLN